VNGYVEAGYIMVLGTLSSYGVALVAREHAPGDESVRQPSRSPLPPRPMPRHGSHLASSRDTPMVMPGELEQTHRESPMSDIGPTGVTTATRPRARPPGVVAGRLRDESASGEAGTALSAPRRIPRILSPNNGVNVGGWKWQAL